jgi:hypothetical protein
MKGRFTETYAASADDHTVCNRASSTYPERPHGGGNGRQANRCGGAVERPSENERGGHAAGCSRGRRSLLR